MGCGRIGHATRGRATQFGVRHAVELGEDFGWWDGELGDEVFGDVGCGETQGGGFGAAEVPAVEVEAVAEE